MRTRSGRFAGLRALLLIASLLLLAVTRTIFRMTLAVLTPIIPMTLRPAPLRLALIVAVVGVFSAFALLPVLAPLALTCWAGTIALARHLRARLKTPTTSGAASLSHICFLINVDRKQSWWCLVIQQATGVDGEGAMAHCGERWLANLMGSF